MGAGFSIVARGNESADVFLYEDIGASFFGGVTAKDFSAELKKAGQVKTLNVRINSEGGDVFDGFAIYNQLAQHSAKVIVHIDGLAASIASVIAMAGDEIRIAEAGYLMIHNAHGVARGGPKDMRDMANLLEKVTDSIADVYVERSGKDKAAIIDMMTAETWMTGDEALSHGFADEMVTNLRIAAKLDLKKYGYRHAPVALLTTESSEAPSSNLLRPNFQTAADTIARMKARFERRQIPQSRPA